MRKERFPILIIITASFVILTSVFITARYYSDSQHILNDVPDSTYSTVIHTDGRLDLNTASAQELSMLPGIGDKLSQRIIAYREENGPFKKVSDLEKVKGIGTKLLDSISDYLTVGD